MTARTNLAAAVSTLVATLDRCFQGRHSRRQRHGRSNNWSLHVVPCSQIGGRVGLHDPSEAEVLDPSVSLGG